MTYIQHLLLLDSAHRPSQAHLSHVSKAGLHLTIFLENDLIWLNMSQHTFHLVITVWLNNLRVTVYSPKAGSKDKKLLAQCCLRKHLIHNMKRAARPSVSMLRQQSWKEGSVRLPSAYSFHLWPQHLIQGPVQPKADGLAACQTSYTGPGAILTHRGQKPFKTAMMDFPGDTVVPT